MAKSTYRLFLAIVLLTALFGAPEPMLVAAQTPFEEFGLGLVPSEGVFAQLSSEAVLANGPVVLPPMVDLSAYLPPVRSQGPQGSCVGWTLAYYYKTFQERVERGWDVTVPTHQYSPAYLYNLRPTSNCSRDEGMSYLAGMKILLEQGAAPLSSFPYNPADSCTVPSAAVREEAWPYRITGFSNVFAQPGQANLAQLKSLLATGEPIAVAVPVYTSFYNVTYDRPVVPRPASGETLYGGHAMLVVGYDDAIGGFKAVNSWGPAWGRNGFCYLSYDFVQHVVWEGWIMYDYTEVLAPATLQGYVLIDGKAAPIDTPVTAIVDGTQIAETSTTGTDRATYELVVPADDPATPEREGASVGDLVQVAVNGRSIASIPWKPNQEIPANLALRSNGWGDPYALYVPCATRGY